jgi:transketolase
MYSCDDIEELKKIAHKVRIHIVKSTYTARSGHPGGSLSAVEILTALYFKVMKHDPKNPKWPDRDRFVLSKGHAAPALYAVLAEAGYFDVSELQKLRKLGSMLQGHPDMLKTPGVEASTGSEGQGLSIGVGMALASKLDARNNRIYVMIGDGENDCGQIWEAALAAAHFKLDNLTAILDRNKLQLDGPTEHIMSIEPVSAKWRAFGWNVTEVDGHDFSQILSAFESAKSVKSKPSMIVANTIKGKGVSFMEGNVKFHGKAPNDDEYRQAMKELGAEI